MTERRFKARQRVSLYLAAGGTCSICGVTLTKGWHADHIVPWVAHGRTDVINGQALCPSCNLRKGDTMLPQWTKELRSWQERAFYRYVTVNKADFLLVATPGAGKTIAAARIAHNLLDTRKVERIVIVCPTDHLKRQWAKALAPYGIAIQPTWSNSDGIVAADYHGVVVTYQQVACNPDIHRYHCKRPTLLIADEIHHAGEGNTWGDAVRHAFAPAVTRLLLSGTPFRSDKNNIPFVVYADDGTGVQRSKADFSYGYGDALRDGVCRPVLFPSYEGTMEWESGVNTYTATFRDEIPERESRHRLKTALKAKGDWISTVLTDANKRLTEIRHNGHPTAGGLIICADVAHAKTIAPVLEKISGNRPSIVISEDPGASDEIERFASGSDRWLVAVKMVSEGVDIPRLRIGVYATNIISELFFRQVIGRFVRMTRDAKGAPAPEEQSAFLFIPRDEQLIAYAQRVKEERDHELDQEIDEILERPLPESSEERPKQTTLFLAGDSTGWADDVFYDHQIITQEDLQVARTLSERNKEATGVAIMPEVIVQLFRLNGTPLGTPQTPQSTTVPATPALEPLHIQKQKASRLVKRLVTVLKERSGQDHAYWYTRLMQIDGVRNPEATLEQLQNRIEILRRWTQE